MNSKLLYFLSLTLALYLPAKSQIITTYAGNGTNGYSGDGFSALSAQVFFPFDLQVEYDGSAVVADASGNIIFSDQQNNVIRKVNATTGIITTVVGNGYTNGTPVNGGMFGFGSGQYTGDGLQATAASLNNPAGIALNAAGDLYICDYNNSVIRKVNHSTNVITTVAGINGVFTSSGDGGQATAAGIGAPIGITIDAAGNYYIADADNKVVRKVNTSGVISTVAGGGASTADGAAATAEHLDLPYAIVVDASGNLYISEAGNTSNRIRKVNSSGVITTFAGNGTAGTPTSGVVATSTNITAPRGMTRDALGNFYIASGCYVCKISTSNIITFVSGTSTCGYSGDFGQANVAELNYPDNLAFNSKGDLFIIDDNNFRVRKIGTSALSVNEIVAGSDIQVTPNPGYGKFSLNIPASSRQNSKVVITNIIGQVVKEMQADTNNPTEVTLDVPRGIYLVTALTTEGKYTTKIIVQ